jgi:hypothetical protein
MESGTTLLSGVTFQTKVGTTEHSACGRRVDSLPLNTNAGCNIIGAGISDDVEMSMRINGIEIGVFDAEEMACQRMCAKRTTSKVETLARSIQK